MNDAKAYVFPNQFTNIRDLQSQPNHSYDVLSGVIEKNLYEEIPDPIFDPSFDKRTSIRIDKTESNNENNNYTKQPLALPFWTRKKLIIAFSLLALIVIVLVIAVVFIVLATASKAF